VDWSTTISNMLQYFLRIIHRRSIHHNIVFQHHVALKYYL
jgi:hypothetical protein